MSNTKRLFAAIKIQPDSNFLELFENIKLNLKHEKIKWVETHNLHLTLKFFGETTADKILEISNAIESAVSDTETFLFDVEKTGIFGSKYQPKVIWAGIPNAEPIIQLENSIFKQVEKIGIYKDRQNFVPHLTLGRIKFLNDKNLFQEIISDFKEEYFQEVKVDSIYLFESILKKTGPKYNVTKEFKL